MGVHDEQWSVYINAKTGRRRLRLTVWGQVPQLGKVSIFVTDKQFGIMRNYETEADEKSQIGLHYSEVEKQGGTR